VKAFFRRRLLIFRKQMSHVFAEAENYSNDHNNGANSTYKKHPHQNVIQSFQEQMHSKSVLLRTRKA
jgi:hypothetical protein